MDLQTWLSLNWQPLLIGGIIGLIIGWLVTYFPMRGRAQRAEANTASLNTKLAAADKSAKEAQAKAQDLESDLSVQQSRYNTAQSRIASLQGDLEAVTGQKDAVDAMLLERSAELEQMKTRQLQLLEDEATLQASYDALAAEDAATKLTLDGVLADLAAAKEQQAEAQEALSNKEVALNEAYLRAVRLQRELMEHQSLLADTQTDLAEARRNVAALSGINSDLDNKLQNARGEVAGELALLTSTMLRMKEESLNQANHRIAALTAELEAMRAGKAAAR
ncbi:MAG: hypothetical protein KDI07_10670 [Anaerolineae bacterium]|nr:hypothetical protein [Anaerolineae bacterium]MCB9133386.1 hypothetical protein [Anaerolineales bacterium]MCB0240311.1 hypothetical protein [Anaerolineae bacterium]MCB0244884.1 hypothetical protein [Anaerolineae bacterium]MCB0249031.1 hypothetical protein [Anaerolineae bacterium]